MLSYLVNEDKTCKKVISKYINNTTQGIQVTKTSRESYHKTA